MAAFKMKIYYLDAIVIPLSATSENKDKNTHTHTHAHTILEK